jgi:hypothetical protein
VPSLKAGQVSPPYLRTVRRLRLLYPLPNTDYSTALIGGASNVANALLGPDETIFGTAIVGPGGSVTFDFSFQSPFENAYW